MVTSAGTVGILVAAIVSVVASSAEADIRAAARAELASGYQTKLPHNIKATKIPPPELDAKSRKDLEDVKLRSRRLPAVPILNALLWALGIACFGLFVFFFAREFFGYLPDAKAAETGTVPEPEPDVEVVSRPLGDAEALARRGLFREAIHTLLLRTLEELKRRDPRAIPSSFTSREILARVSIPEQARAALAGLITAVEITHFGRCDPTASDYGDCLDSFHRFARAYMGAAR